MASRKQRRRREKRQRYEWEYLEVDGEGNETPVETAKPRKATATANGKPSAKPQAQRARSGRPAREVKPPSWNRAIKRGALFVPFLYLFLTALQHVNPLTAAGISLLYSAVFVPMFFFVDRMAYRAYQRKLGQG
jgi:hypothetical protein